MLKHLKLKLINRHIINTHFCIYSQIIKEKKLKRVKKGDTCFYIEFQWLFKNRVFLSVALVKKKVMGYFRFFFHRTGFLTKKSFKLLFIKSHKISR